MAVASREDSGPSAGRGPCLEERHRLATIAEEGNRPNFATSCVVAEQETARVERRKSRERRAAGAIYIGPTLDLQNGVAMQPEWGRWSKTTTDLATGARMARRHRRSSCCRTLLLRRQAICIM